MVLLVEVSSRDAVLVLVDAELSLDVLLDLFSGSTGRGLF